MLPRDQKTRHQELVEAVTGKVTGNLSFDFEFRGYEHDVTSDTLGRMIGDECRNTLSSFNLTDTEKEILEKADLEELVEKLAGVMNRSGSFNIVSGEGFRTTGITKLYFDSLSSRAFKLGMELIGCDCYLGGGYATHDKLKGDSKVRQKAILSLFGQALLSLATPEQLRKLKEEMENSESEYVQRLRKPRSFYRMFIDQSDTKTFLAYQTQLNGLISVAGNGKQEDGQEPEPQEGGVRQTMT